MTAPEQVLYDPETQTITCRGDWDVMHLSSIETALEHVKWPDQGKINIDGSQLQKMDSAGAWLLLLWQKKLEEKKLEVEIQHLPKQYQNLLELVKKSNIEEKKRPSAPALNWFAVTGIRAIEQFAELKAYLYFVGYLTMEFLRIIIRPKHFRWQELLNIIYRTGYQALGIIALLSIMIGVVVAYQMGIQLRSYGANVYIVDLLGISMFREFGPLLTAIMVSGRTGSSFTAQLGMMKINQEIDALNTIGVTPAELLLIPRILGLFIVLPLLTMWANIFGVLGGMVMANNMLHITYADFIHRFPVVVHLKALLTGLGKAPIFALIIASIGCFEGMQVQGSATSVGHNTTRSVVLAIFFIIVADAIFSVIFNKFRL